MISGREKLKTADTMTCPHKHLLSKLFYLAENPQTLDVTSVRQF